MAVQEQQTSSPQRTWMNVPQLADYLGLKSKTVYRYIEERRIPFHRIPGSQLVRFRLDEVDAWMDGGYVETLAEYVDRQTGERMDDAIAEETERPGQ